MNVVVWVAIGLIVVWLVLEVTGLRELIWGIRTYRDGLEDRRKHD